MLIEGVRIIKRHLRKSQDNPQGKIAEREGPIHISNVRLIEKSEKKGKAAKRRRRQRKRKRILDFARDDLKETVTNGKRILQGLQRTRDAGAAGAAWL